MWSWLGRLFGSEKTTNTLIETASSGIDKMFYTDEEKAEDMARDRSEARKMVIGWLANTQGQNLARRLIALSITFGWLLMKFSGVFLSTVAIWKDLDADKVAKTNEIMENFSADMTPAVMLILGFYFAAPHMGKIADVALQRFGQRNNVIQPTVPRDDKVIQK